MDFFPLYVGDLSWSAMNIIKRFFAMKNALNAEKRMLIVDVLFEKRYFRWFNELVFELRTILSMDKMCPFPYPNTLNNTWLMKRVCDTER